MTNTTLRPRLPLGNWVGMGDLVGEGALGAAEVPWAMFYFLTWVLDMHT